MKTQNRQRLCHISLLIMALALTSCASGRNSSYENPNKEHPAMGHRGQGGHPGPPANGGPEDDRGSRNQKKQEITAEAIAACGGKQVGDKVEYISSDGALIRGVCREYEDHLVAMPHKR